jgi:putative endonuclease
MARPAPTDARRRAYRRGHFAEAVAAWYLRAKGFRILARRYVSPVGEIDLVARRGNLVVFVEVKMRRDWDMAAHAIGRHQQHRIVQAARHWLQKAGTAGDGDLRFDAVLLNRFAMPRHIANAFGET